MGETSPLDDRGRFTVDPKWRTMLGQKVYQVWTPHGLLLVPVTKKTLPPGSLPPASEINGDELYWEDQQKKRLE